MGRRRGGNISSLSTCDLCPHRSLHADLRYWGGRKQPGGRGGTQVSPNENGHESIHSQLGCKSYSFNFLCFWNMGTLGWFYISELKTGG